MITITITTTISTSITTISVTVALVCGRSLANLQVSPLFSSIAAGEPSGGMNEYDLKLNICTLLRIVLGLFSLFLFRILSS